AAVRGGTGRPGFQRFCERPSHRRGEPEAASSETGTGDASAASGADLAAHNGATPGVSLREPRSGARSDECGARTVRDHRFPGRPSGDDAGAARQVGPGSYAPRGAEPCLTELFWRIAMRKVDPKVEEAVETLNMKDGPS